MGDTKCSRREFIKVGAGLSGFALSGMAAGQATSRFPTVSVQPQGSYTLTVPCVIYAAGYIWAAVQVASGSLAWIQQFTTGGTWVSTTSLSGGTPSGADPIEMAYDSVNGNLWITSYSNSAVCILNIATLSVTKVALTTGYTPEGILFDGSTYIYVANDGTPVSGQTSGVISVFNAKNMTLVKTLNSGGSNPDGFAFDGTYLWVTNSAPGGAPNVAVINPATGSVMHTISTPSGSFPLSIVYDGSSYMYAGYGPFSGTSGIAKISVSGFSIVDTFDLPGSGSAEVRGLLYLAAHGAPSIWTCNAGFNNVTSIDAANGRLLATCPLGSGTSPRALAFDGKNIWIANSGASFLTRLRPSQNSLLAPVYEVTQQ